MNYGSGPYTVTFPPGEISIPFEILISTGNVSEGNRNFVLKIDPSSQPKSVIIGDPGQAIVVIKDDDGKLTKNIGIKLSLQQLFNLHIQFTVSGMYKSYTNPWLLL